MFWSWHSHVDMPILPIFVLIIYSCPTSRQNEGHSPIVASVLAHHPLRLPSNVTIRRVNALCLLGLHDGLQHHGSAPVCRIFDITLISHIPASAGDRPNAAPELTQPSTTSA